MQEEADSSSFSTSLVNDEDGLRLDENIANCTIEEEEVNSSFIPEEDIDDEDVIDEKSFMESEAQDGTLYKYFEELQTRLSEETTPAEYNAGTFWIRPMQAFFALKKNKPVE